VRCTTAKHASLNLVLELGIASAIRAAKGNVVLQFAATDQGMELACDLVEHQAIAALWGDPTSQWGEILKQLCWRVNRVPSRRGGQAQGGIRFAARRTSFTCSTIYDIAPGVVPDDGHPLRQFIAMARASPSFGVVDVGNALNTMLDVTAAPNWRQAQAYLGMTKVSVQALNIPGTPVPWPLEETPPLDYSDPNEYVPVLAELTLTDDDGNSPTDVQ
jgi:hypothetical protein